ncbi:MAG: xanthine dehydrogenase family protein subunit M [Pseudomonadota bacterium]
MGFAYEAPRSAADAVGLLSELAASNTRAQVLAGGTDVLVQLRSVDDSPRTIVDIKGVAETRRWDIGADSVYIGAAIPGCELHGNAELKALFPGLVEAVDLIGSTQVQGRASMGGNLCNASPAGDSIPALIANAGMCVIATEAGTRELPVEAFVTGVGRNALEPGEFLLGVRFPKPATTSGDAYLRFIPRTEMDIAVAGAGVRVTLDGDTCTDARVGIGAVAPTALLVPDAAAALIGTTLDEAALRAAAEACSEIARPISDKRGTADYRRKVVGVLCRRAAAIARDRARA